MIRYKSRSIYFDRENGEEITKKLANEKYNKLKTTKNINYEECTINNGERFGTATIEWWHECERKRQLQIFDRANR